MSVIDMKKISLLALDGDKDDILKELMKLGIVQVVDVGSRASGPEWENGIISRDGDPEAVAGLEADMERVAQALHCLSPYDKRKKGLFKTRRVVSENEYEKGIADSGCLWNKVHEVLQCVEHMEMLHVDRNRHNNQIAFLAPWQALNIPLEIRATRTCVLLTGHVPLRANVAELEKRLSERAEAFEMQVVSREKDRVNLFVLCHGSAEEPVNEILRSFAFTRVILEDVTGTAGENIDRARKAIEEIDREYAATAGRIEAMGEEADGLELLYDSLTMQRDRKIAFSHLAKTQNTFMLEGWIPAHLEKAVTETLRSRWVCAVEGKDPDPGEAYPVLLKNSGMAQAVEPVTAMYSLPHPEEIDPNRFMAPFFILFFGLMMGDGGYGLVMILASAFMLRKVKLEEGTRRFMKLMWYCGFSTIFWGALFGSWFGIPALAEKPLWLNPVTQPEKLLTWSLIFGIVHIYAGIAMKAANLFRKKQYLDAVLEVLPGYVIFTGFACYTLPFIGEFDPALVAGMTEAGKYLLAAGLVLMLLTGGRKKKNPLVKFLFGFVRVYDVVRFMSDILSYCRLMALGLASSVVAAIINQMGTMGGVNSVGKGVVFVLIMLVGHLLTFALSALSAYVHCSRLQYIEFFGRFYKGGGMAFRPFRTNTRYIHLRTGVE